MDMYLIMVDKFHLHDFLSVKNRSAVSIFREFLIIHIRCYYFSIAYEYGPLCKIDP